MTEFEEIYREYFDQVYIYIRRLSGDAHLAEDITGETFYKALRSLHRFRGDCDIRIWLCQIAKNCYYTHLKKLRRVDSVDSADLLAGANRRRNGWLGRTRPYGCKRSSTMCRIRTRRCSCGGCMRS
mgnify:CR=1 FL=1